MVSRQNKDPVADAILETFRSPNESDSNGEIANTTDGLFAIMRAIRYVFGNYGSRDKRDPMFLESIADNLGYLQAGMYLDCNQRNLTGGIWAIAESIDNLAAAVRATIPDEKAQPRQNS